ncbi:hypothetical protein V4F39_04370 [Aquincola sp. MAHUQ-54]|uniref:Uncharacterized protein n=1 Tax=Aquincola agrisoli TaxID=3119538 RepID=A0AAW9PZZ8_9BURK
MTLPLPDDTPAPSALLALPSPWALAACVPLPEGATVPARQLISALAAVRCALGGHAPSAAARLAQAIVALPPAGPLAHVPEDTGTPLSRDEVIDYDRRFAVARHEGASAALLARSMVETVQRFMVLCTIAPSLDAPAVAQQREGFACHLGLLLRCFGLPPELPAPIDGPPLDLLPEEPSPTAWTLWQGFHWTFFLDVQGLVLSLLRFEAALSDASGPRLEEAELELDTASTLLAASGAAMVLASDFNPRLYEDEVRPAMMPPHVDSDRFSGLMAWDHARLVRQWQQLRPCFAALPGALQPAHERFVQAYGGMMAAHKGVCARFAGDGSSLRSRTDSAAVQTLDRMGQLRRQLIVGGGL